MLWLILFFLFLFFFLLGGIAEEEIIGHNENCREELVAVLAAMAEVDTHRETWDDELYYYSSGQRQTRYPSLVFDLSLYQREVKRVVPPARRHALAVT